MAGGCHSHLTLPCARSHLLTAHASSGVARSSGTCAQAAEQRRWEVRARAARPAAAALAHTLVPLGRSLAARRGGSEASRAI